MVQHPQYYIVESSSLPEIFLKVAEANRLLATNEAATIGEACSKTGISRSAYYKYKDTILPFQNLTTGRIITFQFRLHDEPGVLSAILACFASHNANILTINSIIPTGGSALVTISAETSDMAVSLEELLRLLNQTSGVVKAEVLAG